MTDCQNCDGTGLCLNCRHVGGCGECEHTGACPVCQGGNREAAEVEASRTGRPQFVVRHGTGYRVVCADDYVPRSNGGSFVPTIVWATWPPYWTYRRT